MQTQAPSIDGYIFNHNTVRFALNTDADMNHLKQIFSADFMTVSPDRLTESMIMSLNDCPKNFSQSYRHLFPYITKYFEYMKNQSTADTQEMQKCRRAKEIFDHLVNKNVPSFLYVCANRTKLRSDGAAQAITLYDRVITICHRLKNPQLTELPRLMNLCANNAIEHICLQPAPFQNAVPQPMLDTFKRHASLKYKEKLENNPPASKMGKVTITQSY